MSSSELIINCYSALMHLCACITDFRGWGISASSSGLLALLSRYRAEYQASQRPINHSF